MLTLRYQKGHRAPRKKRFSDASIGTVTGTNSKHVMVTRGDAVSSARNAVFNTNELLEAIIMEIPSKTILTLRAVNKHFHEMVMSSPKIQRKLFLKPEEEQTWASKNGEKVLKEAKDGELDEDGEVTCRGSHDSFAIEIGDYANAQQALSGQSRHG